MYIRQKLTVSPGHKGDANAKCADRWFAYVGIALGTILALVLIAVRLYQPLGLAVTIQITFIGYLLLRDRLFAPSCTVREQEQDVRSHPLAGFLVIIVVAVSLLTIAVSADALQRPLWVFLVLAGIPGFILAQRTCSPQMSGQLPLIAQIVILAVAIVFTSVTVFPYNGGDTWAHLYNARAILENQSVQAIEGAYRDYPLYPAVLSILSVSTGLDVTQSSRFLNVFVAVVCLVLLYSLSKQYHTSFQSLALILLLLGSKWFIHWITLVVSMNMALLFYCLLMVILFRRLHKPADTKETMIMFFIAGMVSFFHPVGAIAVIFLVLGFWALEAFRVGTVRTVNDQHAQSQRSLVGLVGVIIIFTLTQWMYFGDFIFDRTIQSLVNAIFVGDSSIQLAASHRDVLVYTLDQLNFYALLGLAGLEIVRQLFLHLKLKTVTPNCVSPEERKCSRAFHSALFSARNGIRGCGVIFRADRLNLYTGLLGLAFVAFGYATQAIGLQGVLPYRWFLFGTLLLVFPASCAFTGLFHVKSGWVRVLAVGIVIVYFFTGLTNTENNRDHPFYGQDVTQLFELTSSEYAGLITLQQVAQERDINVRSDYRLWDYLKYVLQDDQSGYWHQIQLDGFDGVFSFRTAYLHYQVLVDSTALMDRKQLRLSQFYDSGDMQLFDYVGQAASEE